LYLGVVLKIGVHGVALSLPFGKGATPAEVFETVTKAGVRCLTIPIKSPTWGIDPEKFKSKEIKQIEKSIPKRLEVTGIGYCWPNEYNMITESPGEWNRNLNYANKLREIASEFDAEHIVIGTPGRSVPSGVTYYDGVKRLVGFWKEACEMAESDEVIFCIEHSSVARSNVGNTTKSLIDLVDAVDSSLFKMIAQIGDMAVNDLDVMESIRYAGDRIKQVHIADVSGLNPLCEGWSSMLLPGNGVLGIGEIFGALKDIGYEGEICVEALFGDDPVSSLTNYRKYIQKLWKQA
jgi:sugar phosphate isomerase/epimerase